MDNTIVKNIADRQQAIILDLCFLLENLRTYVHLWFLCLEFFGRCLLVVAAGSAEYCRSGSTPTNRRLDTLRLVCGRLIVCCMSCKLFRVIDTDVMGLYIEEGVQGDRGKFAVGIAAGTVVAQDSWGIASGEGKKSFVVDTIEAAVLLFWSRLTSATDVLWNVWCRLLRICSNRDDRTALQARVLPCCFRGAMIGLHWRSAFAIQSSSENCRLGGARYIHKIQPGSNTTRPFPAGREDCCGQYDHRPRIWATQDVRWIKQSEGCRHGHEESEWVWQNKSRLEYQINQVRHTWRSDTYNAKHLKNNLLVEHSMRNKANQKSESSRRRQNKLR